MAEFADSERVLWQQAEMLRRSRVQILELQQVIAILARRPGGPLVITPEEMITLPSGTWITRSDRPDGAMVIRAETGGVTEARGEPEPGSAG